MKLVKSLSRRVVLVAIASGLVGVVIALLSARNGIRRGMALAIREQFDRTAGQRCLTDPEHFVLSGPGAARTFAYDLDATSQNPDAPPLARDLVTSLRDAEDGVAWAERLGGGACIVVRTASAGPCSVLSVSLSGRIAEREGVGVAAWAMGASMLTAALLGLVLVVLPLARRTTKLREAAARLGVGAEHEGAASASGDELDVALLGLERADARIRADAGRLAERYRSLERHLANVAHDVRTPLAAMQLLLEQAADAAGAEGARELLGAALGECVYLSDLTENLRLMSLMDEGWAPRASPEPFDLRSVVERTCARARALARRRGVAVDEALPDEPVSTTCDPIALERVLANLVDNAVAHNDRGGHVAVTVTVDRGGGFLVRVLDDGPGLAAAELERLAAWDARNDESRPRPGLGLAITAELCARAGFELRFEPLEPRGLDVSVRRGPA